MAIQEAFTQLTREQLADQRERTRLTFTVPELRARMLDQLLVAIQLMAALVAERTGRRGDDLQVRVLAGGVIGAVLAAALTVLDDAGASFEVTVDDALRAFEAGLQLRRTPQ